MKALGDKVTLKDGGKGQIVGVGEPIAVGMPANYLVDVDGQIVSVTDEDLRGRRDAKELP